MIVRFAGFPHAAVYSSAVVTDWRAGETRDVPPEEAARLTATFPGVFEIVEQPDPKPARKRKE